MPSPRVSIRLGEEHHALLRDIGDALKTDGAIAARLRAVLDGPAPTSAPVVPAPAPVAPPTAAAGPAHSQDGEEWRRIAFEQAHPGQKYQPYPAWVRGKLVKDAAEEAHVLATMPEPPPLAATPPADAPPETAIARQWR